MKNYLLALLILLLSATMAYSENPSKGGKTEGTGAAAMSVTFSAVRNTYLKAIKVHLSSAATQNNLIAYIDSGRGAVYDVVLLTQAMAGIADVVYTPDGDVLLEAGDVVTVTFTNTDTRTWGTEISYEY